MSGRGYVLAALLSGTQMLSVLHAAEMPDGGLLEFLGSVDTQDQAWHDYLARVDIDKVARRSANGPNNPIGTKGQPAADPPAAPPPKPTQPVTPP